MLEVRGLDVAYGESQILWDVSLQVETGSVVCLMGRNGVGKTTFLKSIMRGDRPFVFTNLRDGTGADAVVDWMRHALLFES